jgi:DNA/RNA endonuclease G (NUC1)
MLFRCFLLASLSKRGEVFRISLPETRTIFPLICQRSEHKKQKLSWVMPTPHLSNYKGFIIVNDEKFMKKLLTAFWHWLARIFSLPQAESQTTDNTDTAPSKPASTTTDKPHPTDAGVSHADDKGYNIHFLGVSLPLPKLPETVITPILDYKHFSIAMNKARKMPYFTAVNIDAVKYNKLKSQIPSRKEIGADTWIVDPRVNKNDQLPKSFYSKNDFDLGHMVRREDALWGDTLDEALAANNDTFYLTNATPQHKDFNRNAERWKGLEDYALRNARQNDLKISVFTGCIFTNQDRKLGDVRIPAKFWKVIVMIKEDGEPSATGYIVQQDDLIHDITERGLFVFDQFKTYQVDLKSLEEESGLKFGLNHCDPLQKLGTRSLMGTEPLLVESFENIIF